MATEYRIQNTLQKVQRLQARARVHAYAHDPTTRHAVLVPYRYSCTVELVLSWFTVPAYRAARDVTALHRACPALRRAVLAWVLVPPHPVVMEMHMKCRVQLDIAYTVSMHFSLRSRIEFQSDGLFLKRIAQLERREHGLLSSSSKHAV